VILADTSVWIDHFRSGDAQMRDQLQRGQIATHPLIVGELALGSLRQRTRTLALLDQLPHVVLAHTSEVRHMIETRRLYGRGLGLVDAHLIASAFLEPAVRLWTRDKQLRKVVTDFGIDSGLA